MGTPDFAVETLRVLVENGYEVVGVITMPDKPAGRGHKIQYSPVKQYALEKGLRLLQPQNLKDEAFLDNLRSLNADIQIVVAFRMLPEVVWNMPPHGTFNLHASLLPQYRGAAPINWAIINGENKTGATTFFLTHEIDTGKIILQREIAIADTDNAGIVHDKLMVMGSQMVKETLEMIMSGGVDAVDQSVFINNDVELKAAPKIFKETCKINFDANVDEINNFVRGLSPYPAAWTELCFEGMTEALVFKVYEVEKQYEMHDYAYGTLLTDNKKYCKVAAKDGFVVLKQIQAAGKKRMEMGDFLRGYFRS